MNMPATENVVQTSVVVRAPQDRAFRVFTEQLGAFKPREHNMLSVEIAETVLEPHVGGSVFDRGVDGTVCRWARVLAYEPPARLVISWDISPRWQIETDPDRSSEVEILFIAESEDRTRVELAHRRLERHGAGWESIRDGVAGADGWPLYLERYAELCARTV
jgi:uncharacterized protein YndB with AHSA1/START domain